MWPKMTGPRAGPVSSQLRKRALAAMPGGVSSPVRAFSAVGSEPFFVARGEGARVVDVDNNSYLDYVGSWGPLIHGHANPLILEAIETAARAGTTFGACTESEVLLAELARERIPSLERVRLVSSGTEAAMSAIRLARGATGRDRVIKMDGCYHGHADGMLVAAGSGALTFGVPSSAGVTIAVASDTIVVPFNDLAAVGRAVETSPGRIAAVIVEPVAANMGVVLPADGYLEGLRHMCTEAGALLIFDEVVTGFRVAAGGAQERWGVRPDLTILGKVLGGGLPLAAYGGREDLMRLLAPEGPVYQAGTLSGNPLATAAGIAALKALTPPAYERLEALGGKIVDGLADAAETTGVRLRINRVGSMWTAFFTPDPVVDASSARRADTDGYARFFRACLTAGVFLPPSQFEACFVSLAHSEADIDTTLEVFRTALKE